MGKVIMGTDGRPVRMFGTAQDITARRSAELAMQRSDERFRTAAKATRDLIYEIDLLTGQLWCNDVLEEEYGYALGGTMSSRTWWHEVIHEADVPHMQTQLEQLVRGDGETWSIEHRLRKADGSYAHVRNRAYVLRGDSGEAERIIGSCLDITESKRLDRAKDDFISLVSHQLRTPLTVIRLYGNMLTDGMAGELAETQHQYASNMTNASIRLIKLVSDILNISRLELERLKIDPVDTDVNALIKQHLAELSPIADQRHIFISFTPDKDLPAIPMDATIFGEIFSNLVGNALRYSPEGTGRITVRFRKVRQGYRLTVADNGIGIPRDAQEHIFERFYRADNAGKVDGEGSGLGLYLVKLFSEAAGGTIGFTSTEGKGTSFTVQFPPHGMQARTT
jgi:PAS domain S-box-containing protein